MANIETLISILILARELGNESIAKEAVISIASEYGIVPNPIRYKSLKDIPLYTSLHRGSRISAIKELRERAMENGLSYGLKEAKEEVDRRLGYVKETGDFADRW